MGDGSRKRQWTAAHEGKRTQPTNLPTDSRVRHPLLDNGEGKSGTVSCEFVQCPTECDGLPNDGATYQPFDGGDTVLPSDYSHRTQFAGESGATQSCNDEGGNYSTSVCELPEKQINVSSLDVHDDRTHKQNLPSLSVPSQHA